MPCLDCGQPSAGNTRCATCQQHHTRRRDRQRGSVLDRFGPGWARISKLVLERDGGICQLQLDGCTHTATTADHIIPRRHGGTNDPANLRAACRHCNSARRD